MITFDLDKHKIKPNQTIVRVLKDGNTIATIYQTERGLKIVSAHFMGGDLFFKKIRYNEDMNYHAPIPSIGIDFDPKPYAIENGKIIRRPA